MQSPECRLFVCLARDAPLGVVLRRGPSAWVQTILWQTRRDEFTNGAWFKGRIYEDRCDLSPDGSLFLYFCHGGRPRPGYTDSWTAVSRPPWLHALALWPWGTTYGGGGRFVDDRRVVLNVGDPRGLQTHPDHPATGLAVEHLPGSHYQPNPANPEGVPDADWSGRDHGGHLVYSQSGILYRAARDRLPGIPVADFRERTVDPQPAPDWARKPLR